MTLREFINKNREKIKNIINTNVNNQSYRLTVIGRSGSGKSYWINNFLQIESSTERTYIFVITPIHNKDFYSKISKYVLTEMDTESILNNIKKILKFAEMYKNVSRFILLFDDIISEKLVNDDEFKNLFATARHYNINIIFIIQAYTRVLSPFMKDQLTHYLLFGLGNPRAERQIIYDLIVPILGNIKISEKKSIEDSTNLYDKYITQIKYGNILIDNTNHKIIL